MKKSKIDNKVVADGRVRSPGEIAVINTVNRLDPTKDYDLLVSLDSLRRTKW